jgi:hypothetical protein
MTSSSEMSLLHVAFPSNATAQQPPLNDTPGDTTTTQQPPSKTVSLLDLARNKLRNKQATSSRKNAQQAPPKNEVDVARLELIRLVRFCGEAFCFTEEEHTEALERALADFDSALTCFRAIKARILAEARLPQELPKHD